MGEEPFPWEHDGLAGNDRKTHAKTMDPTIGVGERQHFGL